MQLFLKHRNHNTTLLFFFITMANNRYNNNYYSSLLEYLSPPPLHLCFFIFILFSVLTLSWYLNYESKFEDMISNLKLFLILSPVLILIVVHYLSSENVPILTPLPEDLPHRAGGSPWGVGLLLVFLVIMISYQSSFHERWFPLVTK